MKAIVSLLGVAMAVATLLVSRYFYDALDYLARVQFELVQREDVTVSFRDPTSSRTQESLRHMPGVLRVEPFRAVAARLRMGHRSKRVSLSGIGANGELRRLIDRRLQPIDVPLEGVALTRALAELLNFHPGETITVELLEGDRGVHRLPVAGLVDELIGVGAYMDASALHRLLREGDTISGAYLKIDRRERERFYSELKRIPTVASSIDRAELVSSWQHRTAESLRQTMRVLVLFAVVLAAGVVYNNARIALAERGHELASLRVLGFTNREVAAMLLGEQALLTLAAVPIGFVLGYALSALFSFLMTSELYRMPLVLARASYGYAFVGIAVSASLSGILVSRRLRQLDLVAVLKTRE